jgi:uncharacterized membrane protein SirB2
MAGVTVKILPLFSYIVKETTCLHHKRVETQQPENCTLHLALFI